MTDKRPTGSGTSQYKKLGNVYEGPQKIKAGDGRLLKGKRKQAVCGGKEGKNEKKGYY